MYKHAILVVLVLAFAAHAYAITLAGNVTLNVNAQNDWKYRSTALRWSLLTETLYYSSTSISATPGSVVGDIIIGGIRPGGNELLVSRFPSAFLAYWSGMYNVSDTDNIYSVDVSTSSGFIGKIYYGLVERNAAGVDVSGVRFNNIAWSITDYSYLSTSPLKYVTLTANVKASCNVSITHAISNHAGVLSLAGAVVTPKVLETIIEIDNWPYMAAGNTLTLVLLAGTGSGSSSKTLLGSGTGTSQVYLQLNASAVISGSLGDVTINYSVSADASTIQDSDIQAALSSKYSGSINVVQYNITYPAGASSIIYDPAVGAGTPVSQEQQSTTSTTGGSTTSSPSNGVAKIVASIFALLVCAAVVLF